MYSCIPVVLFSSSKWDEVIMGVGSSFFALLILYLNSGSSYLEEMFFFLYK